MKDVKTESKTKDKDSKKKQTEKEKDSKKKETEKAADPKEAIKNAKEAAEKKKTEEKSTGKGDKKESKGTDDKKEPKAKESKSESKTKDVREEKTKAKDSKDTKTKPALTAGKVEVGGKSLTSKVSTGDITVTKDQSLQLKEEKNCTDDLGLKPEVPGRSCKDILERSCEEPVNGFYWLNVTDSKKHGEHLNRWRLVQAKCDMEFNHGGWTRILVCRFESQTHDNAHPIALPETSVVLAMHALPFTCCLDFDVCLFSVALRILRGTRLERTISSSTNMPCNTSQAFLRKFTSEPTTGQISLSSPCLVRHRFSC